MPFLFFDDNFVTHSGIRITNVPRLLEPLSFDRSEVALIDWPSDVYAIIQKIRY